MTTPAGQRAAVAVVCPPGPLRGRLVAALQTADEVVSAESVGALPAAAPDLVVVAGSEGLADRVGECLTRWPGVAAVAVGDPVADRGCAPERLLRAGAAGIVEPDRIEAALPVTAAAVRAGQACVPMRQRDRLAPPSLSRRERQALGLIVMGLSNGEIARQLHLTESTVKSHLTGAYRKLGVTSRAEAVDRLLDPIAGLGTGVLSLSDGGA